MNGFDYVLHVLTATLLTTSTKLQLLLPITITTTITIYNNQMLTSQRTAYKGRLMNE